MTTQFKTLDELFRAMKADQAGDDWASLPTFGGHAPLDTPGIWSWDDDRVICGTCSSDITIEPRSEVNVDTHGTTAADVSYEARDARMNAEAE